KPPTITGLAVHLDTSRRTLLDYEDRDDELSHTIKTAKDRIESFAEEQLYTNPRTAGVIFNLVNNYKWVNKSEVDSTIGNKDNKPFRVDMSGLTTEELRNLANSDG